MRPDDLLPLLGSPDASVLGVASLELPSVSTALDTLLRLRSAHGTIYLHLVEWQGYRDPAFLWRVLGYMPNIGQQAQFRDLAIMVTLVYLHPGDDVGDTLRQELDGQEVLSIPFRVVRLWQEDADAAVASGLPGFAVLCPLMEGASAELVERAAALVIEQTGSGRQQADLLTILGIFAESLVPTERFVRMVGREQLMASDLITYLTEERIHEVEREHAARMERERAALERERAAAQAAILELAGAVEDTVIARFPRIPISAIAGLRTVRDAGRLRALHAAVLHAPDQASAERLLLDIDGPQTDTAPPTP